MAMGRCQVLPHADIFPAESRQLWSRRAHFWDRYARLNSHHRHKKAANGMLNHMMHLALQALHLERSEHAYKKPRFPTWA